MKKVIGLERKVRVDSPNFDAESAPTIKKVVMDSLYMSRDSYEKAARCMKIAMILLDSGDEVDLKNEDYHLVLNRLKSNIAGYPNFAISQAVGVWEPEESL